MGLGIRGWRRVGLGVEMGRFRGWGWVGLGNQGVETVRYLGVEMGRFRGGDGWV